MRPRAQPAEATHESDQGVPNETSHPLAKCRRFEVVVAGLGGVSRPPERVLGAAFPGTESRNLFVPRPCRWAQVGFWHRTLPMLKRLPRRALESLAGGRYHRSMPSGRKLRLPLVAASAILLLSGGTWVTTPWSTAYRVNVSSFQTSAFATIGGIDPSRAIQYAGQHWAAYAGAARLFGQIGSTSQTDCDFWGNSVVVGLPFVPGYTDCSRLADANYCAYGGGFRMRLAGCAGFTFGVPKGGIAPCSNPDGCKDLHTIAVHEFGHLVLSEGPGLGGTAGFHSPAWTNWDDPFIMSDALAPAVGSGLGVTELSTGFGSLDVEAVGGPGAGASVWGIGFMNGPLWSAAGIGYPHVTGFGAPSQTPRSVGVGFDFQSGRFAASSWDLVGTVNPSSTVHESRTHQLSGSSPPSSTSSRHLSQPTIVFDTLREQPWMLSRDANHNNYVHLFRAVVSGSTFVWVDQGAIPDIITRMSVGAAYDALTDQIVVLWLSGRGDTREVPRPGAPCDIRPAFAGGGSQPFGCQGEYLMTVLRASDGLKVATSRFIVPALGPTVHGYLGLGAPAVVCESVGLPYTGFPHCQGFVVSKTAAREIVSWRFQPLYGGGGLGAYTDPTPIGGQTDFPISVSSQPAGAGARVVVSVTGSLDRKVYFTSRQCPSCPWNGWASPWSNVARTAPIVRRSAGGSSYQLVVGLE